MRGEADRLLVVAAVLSAAAGPHPLRVVVVVALLWGVRRGSYTSWVLSCALAALSALLHGLTATADPAVPLLAGPRRAGTLALLAAAALLVLATPDVRRLVGAERACPDR